MVFNYYLLREDITTIEQAANACWLEQHGFQLRPLRPELRALAEGDEVQCFFRLPRDPSSPGWTDFVAACFEVDATEVQTLSAASLVLVQSGGRVFAVPFGQGHHQLDLSVIVPNFGQVITLNKSIPTELRHVQKHVPGRRSKKTSITRYYSAPVLDLVGAFSTELLDGIEGKIRYKNELRSLGGLDSLAWLPVDTPQELVAQCKMLLKWHGETKARPKEFKVFENFSLIRLPDKESELDQRMFDRLKSGSLDGLGIVPPNFKVDQEAVKYRVFTPWQNSDAGGISTEIVALCATKAENAEQFYSVRIEAFNESKERVATRQIKDYCSFVDEEEEDWIYCLHDRQWYRMTSDFGQRLDKAVDSKWNAAPGLMPIFSRSLNEGQYNLAVPTEKGFETYTCLDKALITMGADGTGTEPCDLITPDGHFIAVKRGTSFDQVSYVCAQALVSAQSLRESPSFRADLAKQLKDPSVVDAAYNEDKAQFVVALVAAKTRVLPRDLSFNCKLTLEKTLTEIESLGFQARICHIPYSD